MYTKNDCAVLQSTNNEKKKNPSCGRNSHGYEQKAGHLAGTVWQHVLYFLNGICVSRPD